MAKTSGSANFFFKKVVREQGLTLPVGQDNNCVPDALTIIVSHETKKKLDGEDFRRRLPADKIGVSVARALEFIDTIGYEAKMLQRDEKASKARLLLRQDGNYFVLCRMLQSSDDDDDDDERLYHAVAYLGDRSLLADNHPGSRPLKIDDHDRKQLSLIHSDDDDKRKVAREHAKTLFSDFFHGISSEIRFIFQITRKTGTICAV